MKFVNSDHISAGAALVGLGLGVLAIVLCLLPDLTPTSNALSADPVILSERINLLEERIRQLEDNPNVVTEPVVTKQSVERAPSEGGDVAPVLDSLERRLFELGERLDEWILDRSEEEKAEEDAEELVGTTLATEALAGLQETVLDATVDIGTRIDALSTLARFPSRSDAFTPVLPAIFVLLNELKGRDFHQLLGAIDEVEDQGIALLILERYEGEKDPELRRDILRALREAGNDPSVRIAIETAALRDDSEGLMARQILRRYENDINR